MALSTRVSLQWPPLEPEEQSHTMVLTSPGNHFVDIRIFKDKYPYTGSEPIDKVFQWAMSGVENPIEGTGKILFDTEINSPDIVKSLATGLPLSSCKSPPDIGDFGPIEGSLDRQETGEMINPDTGLVAPYIEVWRSLDPVSHSPSLEVREREGVDFKVHVLVSETAGVDAKVVRLGNWVQGILYDGSASPVLSVNRSHFDGSGWTSLIAYGPKQFPVDFAGAKGDRVTVDGVSWVCIE